MHPTGWGVKRGGSGPLCAAPPLLCRTRLQGRPKNSVQPRFLPALPRAGELGNSVSGVSRASSAGPLHPLGMMLKGAFKKKKKDKTMKKNMLILKKRGGKEET